MTDDDEDEGTPLTPEAPQRIDKWLWFARVVKTRTLAAGLVQDGKVRLNRVKIDKPSHTCKVGDVITVAAGGRIRVLKVLAPGMRRGPASEAQSLYEDVASPPSAGPTGQDAPEPTSRPTKKGRRQIAKLRGG